MNPVFFLWCLSLPLLAFVFTVFLLSAFSAVFPASVSNGTLVDSRSLQEFLAYYDTHLVREFLEIFLNNYFAALVLIFFTPVILVLRRVWQKWRGRDCVVSVFEKNLLYLFPGIFLIRQAVYMASILSGFSVSIDKNALLILAGILLPHGLPELLAFSMAGALGMEVTGKLLSAISPGKLVRMRTLGLLLLATVFCAFVEVYFTPRIFVAVMSAVP